MKHNNVRQWGFSLVELSVVMTVIGITLGGALTLATQKTEAEKVNETDERLDMIEEALRLFLIENQRLPCPADGELQIDAAGFGEETTPDVMPQCSGANFNNAGDVYSGVVPVKTLNLPDDVMFDGWNRRITYAVDANYANSGPGSPSPTNAVCDGIGSSVCFKHYAPDPGDPSAPTSIVIRNDVAPAGSNTAVDAVYILISHGKNGFGAYRRFGSSTRNAASTDVKEQENAEPSTPPHNNFDNVFIDASSSETYDDEVRYAIKAALVDNARDSDWEAIGVDLCDEADPVGRDACDGLAGDDLAVCENIADRIYAMCLNQE